MSFAPVTVLVRLAGGFTLSTAASPASTTLGVLSLVTTSSSLAGQICLGIAAAALGASESGTLRGTAPVEALHTFTLDSSASRCFFRDSTTLTPLPAPVPDRLADPSKGAVVARFCTVLPCLAVPSSSLSRLHLPSFSTNLVSTAALQDAMVTTTTPGGQRLSICTCTRTGRHLATFTRRPGSSLYTLATESPQVAASAQVSASGQVAASCSCHLLSHQTLLWHHRLCHPSLPHLCGMHSRLLVSGLPRSLPPLPPSPAPLCLPCVEGRQPAAPHSSFPPTTAPLKTLHMDRFGQDLPVLRLHSDRGVIEVARTSMIHVAAPHFLWPFAVRYAAHQLNLWPCVSFPETSPTLHWKREVGDASVFRVCGSRAFVRDSFADKLSPRAILCGPAPSGVPQVDPLLGPAPVHVAVGSGAARGAASGGAASGGAESEGVDTGGAEPAGVETRGVEPGGAEREGVEPGGTASEGAESGDTEPQGAASSGDSFGASPRLSPQQLREWFVWRTRLRSGATGAVGAGAAGAGGAGVAAGAAAGAGGVEGAGAGDPTESGATGAGSSGASGAIARGARVGGTREGGAGAGGAGVVDPGGASQPPLQLASLLPAPSLYSEQSSGLTECRKPASHPLSPVRTACRVPRLRPPPVPGTHAMSLRPSSVPLRAPPESSLPKVPNPKSDRARAASRPVSRLLASAVADPSFESAAASTLDAELLDFAAAYRIDYATAL
ncbi:unnamed protein product [Closterium sp. NIES-54]